MGSLRTGKREESKRSGVIRRSRFSSEKDGEQMTPRWKEAHLCGTAITVIAFPTLESPIFPPFSLPWLVNRRSRVPSGRSHLRTQLATGHCLASDFDRYRSPGSLCRFLKVQSLQPRHQEGRTRLADSSCDESAGPYLHHPRRRSGLVIHSRADLLSQAPSINTPQHHTGGQVLSRPCLEFDQLTIVGPPPRSDRLREDPRRLVSGDSASWGRR